MMSKKYGDWILEVDTNKTIEYYESFEIEKSQAWRNYAMYCENLSNDEKNFFESLGINPLCTKIDSVGVTKDNTYPCGGYYFVCGKYLSTPTDNKVALSELNDKSLLERQNPKLYIGIYEFDFQDTENEYAIIPEDLLEGFICIRFWCGLMPWLLKEKSETIMYVPPKPWQVHRIIKEKISNATSKKDHLEFIEKLITFEFDVKHIKYKRMTSNEVKKYVTLWINAFSPKTQDKNFIKKICLSTRKCHNFLWHIFSYDIQKSAHPKKAIKSFNQLKKGPCVIYLSCENIAFELESGDSLDSEFASRYTDIIITAKDFSWVYVKTHEEMCGPYFFSSH